MEKVEEIVSDEQLNEIWGNANFGGSLTKREVVKGALLKCASGYYTGFTAKQIVSQLGLVNQVKWTLTPKGKKYLFAAFSGGVSI